MSRSNLLSSNLLGEIHTAAGKTVSPTTVQRDLPRLWEFTIPVNGTSTTNTEQIEIAVDHQKSSSVSSTITTALSALGQLWNKGFTSANFDGSSVAQIAIPNCQDGSNQQNYVAILVDNQLALLRSQQGILEAHSMEVLVFTSYRLGGKALSICWTNEEIPSLMIGCVNGLRLLLLPSLAHVLEHASVELRVVQPMIGIPCHSLCASPQGRFAVISDGSSVWLYDSWLSSTMVLLTTASIVESISWSWNGGKVYIHQRYFFPFRSFFVPTKKNLFACPTKIWRSYCSRELLVATQRIQSSYCC